MAGPEDGGSVCGVFRWGNAVPQEQQMHLLVQLQALHFKQLTSSAVGVALSERGLRLGVCVPLWVWHRPSLGLWPSPCPVPSAGELGFAYGLCKLCDGRLRC